MDQVECNGTEASLLDCEHTPKDDCSAGEGAGVVCEEYVVTEDVFDCQTYCQVHPACSHFSFDKESRKCSLGNTLNKHDKKGVVSGPRNCTVGDEFRNPGAECEAEGKLCLVGGEAVAGGAAGKSMYILLIFLSKGDVQLSNCLVII